MAKIPVAKGKTSKLMQCFIQDSSKIDGSGLTGLTYQSTNLTWYYYVEGQGAPVAVMLADMTLGQWTSGGFKEIDAAHMAGWYQLGLPNAALTAVSGGESVAMHLQGAVNMVPLPIELELTYVDGQVAIGIQRNRVFVNLPFTMLDAITKQPVAGKTVTVLRKLDGGAWGVGGLNNVQDVLHGVYTVDGTAADCNGSFMSLLATAPDCDPTIIHVVLVP